MSTETDFTESDKKSDAPFLVGLVAMALVLGVIGFVVFSGGDDSAAPETDTNEVVVVAEDTVPEELPVLELDDVGVAEEEDDPPAALALTSEDDADDADDADEAVAAEVEADDADDAVVAEVEVAEDDELPPLSSLPERGAIFRPPTLFLEGPIPSQEVADVIVAKAAAVVGPDNIVNNYIIRPDAPAVTEGNVTVEQALVFPSGSAEIAEGSTGVLDVAVLVMTTNPQVNLVIEGHTDDSGTDAANLALSQARAEAVSEYIQSRGIEAGRLEAIGFGESAPIADNTTSEGRGLNRRIQFELLDLLAG